jgi:hypothetical protein
MEQSAALATLRADPTVDVRPVPHPCVNMDFDIVPYAPPPIPCPQTRKNERLVLFA